MDGRKKKKMMIAAIAMLASFFALKADAATANAPAVMQYQARLSGTSGPLADQLVDVQAWIYDSPTEGVAGDLGNLHLLYAERHDDVRVQRGMLRVGIGEGEALGGFAGAPLPAEKLAAAPNLYLQLIVNNERIEPRQRFGVDRWALRAEYARTAKALSGNFTLTAADLPNLPASKATGVLPRERVPQLDRSRISGDLDDARIPTLTLDIITSGLLDNAFIGGIDSSDITSGTFSSQRFSKVLYGSDLTIWGGPVSSGDTIPGNTLNSDCAQMIGITSFTLPEKKADGLEIGTVGWTVVCSVTTETKIAPGIYQVGTVPCGAQYLKVCVRKD